MFRLTDAALALLNQRQLVQLYGLYGSDLYVNDEGVDITTLSHPATDMQGNIVSAAPSPMIHWDEIASQHHLDELIDLNPADQTYQPLPQITYEAARFIYNQHPTPSHTSAPLTLSILLYAKRLQISFNGPVQGMSALLAHAFAAHDNRVENCTTPSYLGSEWSFIWSATPSSAFVEMWLPADRISETSFSPLLDRLLQPLGLSASNVIPHDMIRISQLRTDMFATILQNHPISHMLAGDVAVNALVTLNQYRRQYVLSHDAENRVDLLGQPGTFRYGGTFFVGTYEASQSSLLTPPQASGSQSQSSRSYS